MFQYCDCLVVSPTHNASIMRMQDREMRQAYWQWSTSLISLILGAAYMMLFLRRAKEMWIYPQNLAFWIVSALGFDLAPVGSTRA